MAGKLRVGKLTAPDASGLLRREALCRRLDDALGSGKLAWIAGPAGTGKTSLLASWVAARRLPAIWYQVDGGDHDLAAFFHYLSLAARQTSRTRLPITTPENLMAPETFARRYFTRLFQGWQTPHIWVLDNYQELPESAPLHGLIDIALDLLPDGCLIAVASRHEAPPPLRRHFAYAHSAFISWDDLRLSGDESADLAKHWGIPADRANTLHAICDGWAALQVLLMRLPADRQRSGLPLGDERLFDYLSSEIYEKLDPDLRSFLAKVALLPFVTPALAKRVGGRPDADTILARLDREHFLTTRHGAAGTARYQFHPLLRAFLLSRLGRDFPEAEVRALKRQAAHALEQDNEAEAAAGLLLESEDWPDLAALLRRQAPPWMAEGRMGTLRHWLDRLPEDVRQGDPWLLYWHGSMLRMFDPRQARDDLEQAFRMFKSQGEHDGSFMALASLIESFATPWDDYSQVGGWLTELSALYSLQPVFSNPSLEAQVLGSGVALLLGAPYHPLVRQGVERAQALLLQSPAPQHIGPLCFFIALYHNWRADQIPQTQALLAKVDFPKEAEQAFPLSYILYALSRAVLEWCHLQREAADEWVARALDAGEKSGVHLMDHLAAAQGFHAAASSGDAAAAAMALAVADEKLNPAWKLDVIHTRYLHTILALMRGDTTAALAACNGLLESTQATGAVFPVVAIHQTLAEAYVLSGQAEKALEHLPPVLEFAERFPSPQMAYQTRLVEAHARFLQNEQALGLDALKEAMAIGSSIDSAIHLPVWLPQLYAPLCARALEAGIEVAYVRRLIRRRGLLPPSPSVDTWPWPLRIYTLGRFAVLRDDEPLIFSGKAQKRPLQLLKMLIGSGGRGVSAATLADTMWGDGTGDARHALDMAVSRLRKLLGRDEALQVQDGKLSLNDKLCWLDIWSFERLADEAGKAPEDRAQALRKRALAHYSGQFLAGEDEAGWLLPRRERLRSRYIRLVLDHALKLERAGDRMAAVDAYRRALEIEPLAEEIAQRLMAAHLKAGEKAQALEVFRRLRDMLSIVLGIAPSRHTLALAEQAKG